MLIGNLSIQVIMIGEAPGVWVADVEMIDVVSTQGLDVDSAYGTHQLVS